MSVIKTTKVVWKCEVCGRTFKSPTETARHETACRKKHEDCAKFEGLFLALVHHFEKEGYKVTARYFDSELLFELRKG